ncbi:50S ribosomal protein L39e [Candidatus Woesearchaeota archaeon]|nr:50S ribosomal protein L39e [Candidatus Woesearchaeota archaeon]
MARNKHPAKKGRLIKRGRQTRWAPIWTIPRKYGKGRVLHPSRNTFIKRSWRRTKLKV